ncbi:hypothetical protein POTOM_057794 [Populus tomentosa]|uniref:TOG domain-containing protein n=1 Tax=Populus tomentosa TaxID=118781 RepID=A0A8X8BWP0_POPTO|nr:hypothetical protein POTOM_057794 [Populus tomentosa]
MSKHLIETHHKPSAKTHRWSTLFNGLNLRTHPTPKPLTRPLKPSPPLLLIFFFFKPNPFLVDGATISKKTPLMVLFFNLFDRRRMILYFKMYIKQDAFKLVLNVLEDSLRLGSVGIIGMLQVIQGVLVLGKVLILREAGFVLGCPYPSSLFGGYSFLSQAFGTFYDFFQSQPPGVPWLGLLFAAPILNLALLGFQLLSLFYKAHLFFAASFLRCASFRAHPGTDNVQAAQKFITDLDARRLSKFPEYRYGDLKYFSALIKFVDPLLQSPIVSDVAYETLVKLSRCTAAPLCHWALDIATALRLIVTKDVSVFLDLIPIVGDREANESPSLGLFERIINGLSVSCKPGPLPVDSFTFVFPIMEHILLSPKKTGLHDDVLRILFLHMDPLLPLPRLRMLSALYHVLGVVLAYQGSIGPALNELCLGLQPEEVAPALYVYAKDVHKRFGLPVVVFFDLIEFEALAAALDENPDTTQDTVDAGWLGRQGIALALHSAADVLRTKRPPCCYDIPHITSIDVRGRMINAGIIIIDKHGRDNVSLLFPIFENYLNKKASDEEKYDLVREGAVIFTGALAKHLAKDDPEVHAVVKLLDVLNTPSEAVQRAVSFCLSPLMQSKKDDAPALVSRLLDQLMNSDKYGERRGAAFGLAGVVKGYGISCSKKYGITAAIRESLADRSSVRHREGAQLAFECFCETLGKLFEPFVCDSNVAVLLVSFSDQVVAVREAAECAARSMMSQLSAQGVKLVLPSILKGLEDKAWRTKQSSVQLLGALAYCAPQQLSQCLPTIVPKLTETTFINSIDAPSLALLVPIVHRGLRERSAETKKKAAQIVGNMCSLVPIVHRGLRERSAETKKKAAQIVRNMCSLVIEPKDMIPYIGLLLPEVKKVLVDAIPEVRSVAARAVGSLIRGMGEENFPDLVPWLFDSLKTDNSNVERSGAAQGLSEMKAINLKMNTCYDYDVILSEENTSFRNLQTSFNRVYLSSGLLFIYLQVLSALGTGYFEHVLLDIIRNCSHQKASMRDGYLTLFKYLPRSLGVQFQNYLQQVLPAILDGLADENESVRDAALGVGHVLVEHYATTSLPLLLPAVEDGILNDNWRIQQSSVELLGDLLFKVAGTSGKSDEGSSTEAHGRAIIEVLGRDKCNEILAALYMVRTDVSLSVRQAALHVWKTIVANTPKTLKEIMPVLMNTLISFLASSSSERRQGVMPEVRESAGLAFSTLYKSAGMQAIDEIVPTLLHALEDDETSDTALDGLKQILSVRTTAVLPHIFPKLVRLPLSAFNIHALGALAEVAGPGLNFHLGTILPALLSAMGAEDKDVQTLAKEAAETVALVIDEEGVEYLIAELLKGAGDTLGLTSGFAELREQAALGLGELIEVTSEKALKDFVIPITGPLIRIIGDRFPWQVKSAILSTLSILIGKGGMSLRPFLPQLQTTFIKCLQDSTRTVRTSAAFALGKLSALSTRVDPLVSDLLSSLQVWHQMLVFGEAILTALKGVLKHAGKSVSDPVRVRVFSQLKDLIHHDDDQVRISAASILGITSQVGLVNYHSHHPSLTLLGLLSGTVPRALKISHSVVAVQYMEEHQLDDLLELLSNLASSPSWVSRHGSVLTISSLLRHNPSSVVTSQMFPSIIHCLKDALKDEKFPLRETSRKALGRLILHQIQSDPSEATAYVDIISTIMTVLHDDSSEASPPSIMVHVSIIGPAFAECLKDSSTPVRLAKERCAMHAFQMTKGTDHVQAA